jgi:hypothetical protein
MRLTTVSEMKGKFRREKRQLPTPGTRIGELHDTFIDAKGEWIQLPPGRWEPPMTQLTDIYGLDIERRGRGRHTMYRLRGEHFLSGYVSYLREDEKT